MAEIRPFCGVRYDVSRVGGLQEVIGPPEDIPSTEQAIALTNGRPYHSVLLEMPDQRGARKGFRQAGERLHDWLAAGVLIRDGQPSLYVYEHEYAWGGATKRRRGFFAALRLSDPTAGEVLPHEQVLPQNLDERIALLRDVQAHLSAVYTLVEDNGRIERMLAAITSEQPDEHGADDEGGVHRLWVVRDPEAIGHLCNAVAGRPLYIADGHHRYAAALAFRDEQRRSAGSGAAEYTLTYIADASDPGIAILPIHRVVNGLDPATWARAMALLPDYFEITELPWRPEQPATELTQAVEQLGRLEGLPAFLVLDPTSRRLGQLRLRDWRDVGALLPNETSEPTRRLDVSVLDSVILRHVLGIDAAEIEARVEFTPDPVSAVEIARSDTEAAAFFVRPTPLASLMEVARGGELMPQKSTYFYPKIPIGLVVYDLLG